MIILEVLRDRTKGGSKGSLEALAKNCKPKIIGIKQSQTILFSIFGFHEKLENIYEVVFKVGTKPHVL